MINTIEKNTSQAQNETNISSNCLPAYWKTLEQLAIDDANEKNLDLTTLSNEAEKLFNEFKQSGYIRKVLIEGLKIHIYGFVQFYKKMNTINSVESPVCHEPNSNWMLKGNFCSFNMRATHTEFEKTGSFLEGIKLLPLVRPIHIHLLPFFDCHIESQYAIDSLKTIGDDFIDVDFCNKGLKRDDQLKIFVDAAHLLNKTVGFDLEPHTQQFSRIALQNPEYFRWIKLSVEDNFEKLYNNMKQEEQMTIGYQKKLVSEVNEVMKKFYAKHNMKTLEDDNFPPDEMRKLHIQAINNLVDHGYWTLLSHTWDGVGVPRFSGFNHDKRFSYFQYVNSKKKDHLIHAFGSLTPYKFYDNLLVNNIPDEKEGVLPTDNEETQNFFSNIFPQFQEKFNFDFLRIDFQDHVLDATLPGTTNVPVTDRCIARVLKKVTDKAREGKPYIGVTAECMNNEFFEYNKMGFNLLVGHNLTNNINNDVLKKDFEITKGMSELNKTATHWGGVKYTIDTHDSGHPLFWQEPLIKIAGYKTLALKYFMSKFTSCGLGSRPSFECVGAQDLSHGLFISNNIPRSITWVSDKSFNNLYHNTFDLRDEFSEHFDNSYISSEKIKKKYATWFIDRNDNKKERLLCIAFLEKRMKDIQDGLTYNPKYRKTKNLKIDVTKNYDIKDPIVYEIDFETKERKKVNLLKNKILHLKELNPFDYKLYFITGS